MNASLGLLGAAIVLVTVADIFFTVLFPASRRGPVRKPLSAALRRGFRLAARLVEGARRRRLISYSGPVVIGATIVAWFILLTLGFALMVKPALGSGIVASGGATETGWATALYYAGYSLTTLGVGDPAPEGAAYRLITVAAAAVGFLYFSMSITYFLSVYAHLTGRNAFAQGLHHLTGRTGDAAVLITRLAVDGDLGRAEQHLSSKADFLRQTHQSHGFYPVLQDFHYEEPYYALPRILLIALDTAALLRSGLDPDRYAALLKGWPLENLREAAGDLMNSLCPGCEPDPPSPEEAAAWRRRHAEALAVFRRAGLQVRTDAAAAAADYVAFRGAWNGPLRKLVGGLLYDWSDIDIAADRRAAPADGRG